MFRAPGFKHRVDHLSWARAMAARMHALLTMMPGVGPLGERLHFTTHRSELRAELLRRRRPPSVYSRRREPSEAAEELLP